MLHQVLLAQEPDTGARLIIPEGTVVHLRLTQTVSSLHTHVGDPLDFIVERDVRVGDFTIIPAGSRAQGSVLGVNGRRILGIGGKVVYGLDSIALANGEIAGVSARRVVKGSSHTWRMIAGMAVTALFYLPAAPVFLLTRGGTSTVLKDTQVTAQIDCDAVVASAGLPRAGQDVEGVNAMLSNLPPRVMNGEGREGDMVNLVFVGQKNDLQAAFARAGWVKTDAWKPPMMAWRLLTQGMHYAKLPMARFYMFGRVQDYSYALPDPDAVVSRRHHLRIWKTQYTLAGDPIWVAAATYDQAIEFAKRGRILNHTIDPQVDTERDFVGTNLAKQSVLHHEYLESANPVFEAETASGQAYHSDSRVLLLDLHQPGVVEAGLARSLSTAAPASTAALQSSLR